MIPQTLTNVSVIKIKIMVQIYFYTILSTTSLTSMGLKQRSLTTFCLSPSSPAGDPFYSRSSGNMLTFYLKEIFQDILMETAGTNRWYDSKPKRWPNIWEWHLDVILMLSGKIDKWVEMRVKLLSNCSRPFGQLYC